MIVTGSTDGLHLWELTGKTLRERAHLSDTYCGFSSQLLPSGQLLLAFANTPKSLVFRTITSALHPEDVVEETKVEFDVVIDAFDVVGGGQLALIRLERQEDNVLLYHIKAQKVLHTLRSGAIVMNSHTVLWPYTVSDDGKYVSYQDGAIIHVYQLLEDQTLELLGYTGAVVRGESVRNVTCYFTPTLKISSDQLPEHCILICMPSKAKGGAGYAMLYKLTQLINCENPTLENVAVPPYMYQKLQSCDRYEACFGESGTWFLLRCKSEVDTSEKGHYYGTSTLYFFNINTRIIECIGGKDQYVHAFSIRPTLKLISPTDSLIEEQFIVIFGTPPPKAQEYVVTSKLGRNGHITDLTLNSSLGSLAVNSISWEPAGRFALLRGEVGMNGESKLVRLTVGGEPTCLASSTIYSKTCASISPSGDVIMYGVTRPRFNVDNGIELFDLQLQPLTQKGFTGLFYCGFLAFTKKDYADRPPCDVPSGQSLKDVKKATGGKYVPPSQRGKK